MDILDEYYPGYSHVFSFDNATTHMKCHDNALSALKMVVNPPRADKPNWLCTIKEKDGKQCQVQMDDGNFRDGTPQALYFPDDHLNHPSCFKGMQEIVRE